MSKSTLVKLPHCWNHMSRLNHVISFEFQETLEDNGIQSEFMSLPPNDSSDSIAKYLRMAADKARGKWLKTRKLNKTKCCSYCVHDL